MGSEDRRATISEGAENLQAAVPEGEALRYSDVLRTGGRLGFTDDRLLVVDDEVTSVELSDVKKVEYESFDYFEALLGVALIGFGLYTAVRRSPLGLLFALAGAVSLYLTHGKRGRARVTVHSRAKPLTLRPADGQAFYDAFERALEDYRERTGAEKADV